MKCCQHPDIWPEHGIDSDKIDLISECQECLDILEHRLLLEIESGDIPRVTEDFSDKVMRNIAGRSGLLLSNRHRIFDRKSNDKRLTFIHYATAAAATIILVMTGGFNILFRSGPEYENNINRIVNDIAVKATISIPESEYLSQNLRTSWEHLQDLKNGFTDNANKRNGR